MIDSPFDILYLAYLAFTESFSIKLLLLLSVYAVAYINNIERKSWYD